MHKDSGLKGADFVDNSGWEFDFVAYAKKVFDLPRGVAEKLTTTSWGDATPYQMGQVLLNLVRTGTLESPSGTLEYPGSEVWKEELPKE